MKYNSTLKLMLFTIILQLFCIESQYCAQSADTSEFKVPLTIPQPIRPCTVALVLDNHETSISIDDSDDFMPIDLFGQVEEKKESVSDLQESLFKKYQDAQIIAYWTTPSSLCRIDMNAPTFNMSRREILEFIIEQNITLVRNKSVLQNKMYAFHCYHANKSLLPYIQNNEQEIKDVLWLQFLYVKKDLIHKNVEQKKINNSLAAWPYIKEIQAVKCNAGK